MAGAIATLITVSKVVPRTATGLRAQNRQAYAELEELQAKGDPELASPYLKASGVSTIAANGGTTGNLTLTINFPKQGVAVTTANIAYNANEAAIQSAIDTAMGSLTVLSSYSGGDIDAGACANFSSASCAVTANGTSVNGAYMVVTTANVDMDVAAPAVTETTVGTQNRPAEAILNAYSVITPASAVAPQSGAVPAVVDYTDGCNSLSLSPGLIDLLIKEVKASEDKTIGQYFRDTYYRV
jgi:hypothetical protein